MDTTVLSATKAVQAASVPSTSTPVPWLLLLAVAWAAACGEAKPVNPVDASAVAATDAAADGASLADGGVDAAVAKDTGLGPTGLRVMTFNVMCSFCMDKVHEPWTARIPYLRDVIARHDPDLIGLQELFNAEPGNDDVESLFGPEHLWGAVYYHHKPGDLLEKDYTDATVMYRKARFELKDQGFFWLSPEPDTAFSNGFAPKGSFPRLVAWARLHDKKAKRDLYFATTHFDNNAPSQEKSAPLSLQRLGPLAKQAPLIFIGDFNSKPPTKAYGILTTGEDKADGSGKVAGGLVLQDAFVLAPPPWQIEAGTQKPPAYDPAQRIDHVFVGGGAWKSLRWVVDLTVYGPPQWHPSDHDAIVADLDWPPP